MCLLESIDSWDDRSVKCSTCTHLDPANPLRSAEGLLALHLVEYGAQAAAVHGGLCAERDGRRAPPGLLSSLRSIRLEAWTLEDLAGPLQVEARRLLADPAGWLYEFSVTHLGRTLASGRLSVVADRSGSPDNPL